MAGFGTLGHIARNALGAFVLAVAAFGVPAQAQPAIWTVKDEDSTIYLLGTVHLLKPDTVWDSEKLDAAIAAADTLWQELSTSDPMALAVELAPLVVKYGVSRDRTLSSILTPDEMKTLDEAAKLGGLSGAALNRFRPWYAALNISNAAVVRAGYDPMSGVDGKIEAKFKMRGIKPNGLETAEEQIKVFAGMGEDEQLSYLRETMKEYRNASTELDTMVTAWASGDVETLENVFVSEAKAEGGTFYDALLTNRNRNWTAKIEEMLAGKGVIFIAVGAGHLVGEDSVLAMLAAKGIKSERYQ